MRSKYFNSICLMKRMFRPRSSVFISPQELLGEVAPFEEEGVVTVVEILLGSTPRGAL